MVQLKFNLNTWFNTYSFLVLNLMACGWHHLCCLFRHAYKQPLSYLDGTAVLKQLNGRVLCCIFLYTCKQFLSYLDATTPLKQLNGAANEIIDGLPNCHLQRHMHVMQLGLLFWWSESYGLAQRPASHSWRQNRARQHVIERRDNHTTQSGQSQHSWLGWFLHFHISNGADMAPDLLRRERGIEEETVSQVGNGVGAPSNAAACWSWCAAHCRSLERVRERGRKGSLELIMDPHEDSALDALVSKYCYLAGAGG